MTDRAAIFQALGDPTRLTLVQRLGECGPLPTGELVDGLPITRQAAAKHLVVLENVGLITSSPKGREVIRTLRLEVLEDAGQWLAARADAWEHRLEALRRLVEEPQQ